MAADNETVADIVCELKNKANYPNVGNDGLVIEISQEEIWDACDRIEAAWRRDNDELLARLASVEEADRNHLIAMTIAEGKLKELERKPKRNCDRFANECDAENAWHEENCELKDTGYGNLWYCPPDKPNFRAWLFAPCEEGGAK